MKVPRFHVIVKLHGHESFPASTGPIELTEAANQRSRSFLDLLLLESAYKRTTSASYMPWIFCTPSQPRVGSRKRRHFHTRHLGHPAHPALAKELSLWRQCFRVVQAAYGDVSEVRLCRFLYVHRQPSDKAVKFNSTGKKASEGKKAIK